MLKLHHTVVSFCALLLCAALLLVCGCDAGKGEDAAVLQTDAGEDRAGEQTSDSEASADPGRERTSDPDPSAYEGLVISKVYGNGGNDTAACLYSFVELTNTGASSLDLGGLALYYGHGKKPEYASFSLPGTILGGGESFLIRAAASPERSAGYDASKEVIRIGEFDAEWTIALGGKEFRLLLAPAGLHLDDALLPEDLPGVISYFAASEKYCFDTGYVSGTTQNTVAVRTAMMQDSGYYLLDLTKATTEKLRQIVPAARNGKRAVIVGSKLKEIRFSHPAGFYALPIGLELAAPDGYGTIYYTTDGSDPASSGTRTLYKGPIPLAETAETKFGSTYRTGLNYVGKIASNSSRMLGAHVIRACAYNGTAYTGSYTNSYFIGAGMEQYGVTVVSVSLDTEQMFGNPGFYHNFNPSSNDPNTRGKAFMEVFDEDGIRRGYSNVQLAASGHGSSGTGMRSMKVYYKASENVSDGTDPALNFDLFHGYARNAKGQRITGFSRLVLRNSGNDHGVSYIRDAFMQRVSSGMAVDTMAYAPVLVFINGDFWGIYNARERYSGEYVQSHYGIDKDNVALIESDYSKVHTNQNAKYIVSSGLEDDADDFNELVRFLRKNDMRSNENYEYVLGKLDVDSLIDLFVARLYFSALDFPGNNIKLWRNRASDDPSGADNRWHFVLLDMDMGISFYKGANDTTETSNYFSWLKSESTVASTVIHRLLANETFKDLFITRFCEALNEAYDPARMDKELGGIVSERAAIEHLQSQRWGANMKKYNESVADMRKFIRRRNEYALKYLCSHFGISVDSLFNSVR